MSSRQDIHLDLRRRGQHCVWLSSISWEGVNNGMQSMNRNGLSSLALRSIIHNKCPQVLEQKSLRETHMQINAREIVHIFCRYLLCGLGCLFPSWRQRSVRGTGECKNMRGYMQSNAREIIHILFRYLLCGLGYVFPRAVRGVYGGQGSAKSTGDT